MSASLSASTHRTALLLTAVATVSACSIPEFQGPQIQDPPNGFTMNPETALQRRMFPDLEVVHHDAWVAAAWGDFSGIYINGHSGVLGMAHMEEARQRALSVPGERPDQVRDIGEIEQVTIDGREALAWAEMVRSPSKGIEYVAYRALIPYDTVSYAVEMVSGDPKFKSRPDTLRTMVATFGVGRTTYNIPMILIAVGALGLMLSVARTRSQERARRHASITLKQIPKKKEGDKADATRPGPPRDPPGSPGAPG